MCGGIVPFSRRPTTLISPPGGVNFALELLRIHVVHHCVVGHVDRHGHILRRRNRLHASHAARDKRLQPYVRLLRHELPGIDLAQVQQIG
jgi:hypothetical protein